MSVADDLLSRGYFPRELPPPFNTRSLPAGAAGVRALIAGGGQKPPYAKLTPYSLARQGMLRRELSIPNPIHQVLLCDWMETHFASVGAVWAGSTLSRSVPKPTPYRAFTWNEIDLREERAFSRSAARAVVRTDISQFYSSIYTHSLEWALIGKPAAKARVAAHGPKGPGATLDDLVRYGQDNQSVGLPIGPDTSLLLAEMVLCAVDHQVQTHLRGVRGFRQVDDYELSFPSRARAEDALSEVQSALAEFQLYLNPRKTSVIELPQPLEAGWITRLKAIDQRAGGKAQQRDLLRLFDTAFELSIEFPEQHVLNYALGVLTKSKVIIDPNNWRLAQGLMLGSALSSPGLLERILPVLLAYAGIGRTLDVDALGEIINDLIQTHVRLGHSSEVASALWAAIELGLPIDEPAAKVLSGTDDPVQVLLALDARERGLMHTALDVSHWAEWMTEEYLWEPQWLVTYEALRRGWLPAKTGNYLATNRWFGPLDRAGVSFYDPGQKTSRLKLDAPSVAPRYVVPPVPDLA